MATTKKTVKTGKIKPELKQGPQGLVLMLKLKQ